MLSLKFVFQDFTDPGLPKDPAESDWFVVLVFCLHKCFSVSSK